MPNHYHLVRRKSKMKNSHRNILILIILAAAALSGCAREEERPHEMPRARPPEGQTTRSEAGDYGKILITGKPPVGEPVKAAVFLYESKDMAKVLASGTANVPLDAVEGNYFVYIDSDPDITYDDIRIRRGETTTLELPRRGRLNIAAKDFEGKPLRITYWVYEKGSWDKGVETCNTNVPVDLPPAEYNIYVNSDPDKKYENVKIDEGKATEFALGDYGALLVKGLDARGKLLSTSIYLYSPGGNDSVSSGFVNKRLDLPAGEYDLRISLNPDIDYKGIRIGPGKHTPLWSIFTAPRMIKIQSSFFFRISQNSFLREIIL